MTKPFRIASALATILLLMPLVANAGESRLRLGGILGVGQASSTSVDGKGTAAEGPLGYSISLDYIWKTSYFIYGEHLRSYGDGSSGIGFTGMGVKYYPWLSPVESRAAYGDARSSSFVSEIGNAYYFGMSCGLAQASVPGIGKLPATIAVGPFLGMKAGYETPLNKEWSFRTELNVDMTVGGSGSIQYLNFGIGVGYTL